MAHEIDFTVQETGGIAITHNGDLPWHGYGERVADDASLDQWRIAAGLNWDVNEEPIFFNKREEVAAAPVHLPIAVPDTALVVPAEPEIITTPTAIENRKALVRSDTQDVLSIVSNGYHVVQPEEVLAFYEELIRANGFVMDTAGSLRGGRRIWALARIGEETRIYGQDKIDGYVLLATSYDGTMATTCQFTSVRVVCNNTLEFATADESGAFKLAHNKKFDADEAKGALGLSHEAWELYEQNANKLAQTTVDLDTAMAFFTSVLGKDAINVDEDGKASYSNGFKKMFAAYERGPGSDLRSANHTAWGLVNAVTFYQDHMVGGDRLNSSWFGVGKNRKAKAFTEALKLAA